MTTRAEIARLAQNVMYVALRGDVPTLVASHYALGEAIVRHVQKEHPDLAAHSPEPPEPPREGA